MRLLLSRPFLQAPTYFITCRASDQSLMFVSGDSLVHMIINAQGSLSLRCRNDIIHCIFRSTIPGQSREASPVGAAVKSNVDALIRQLLMAYRDEKVRKLTLLTLFDAVSMGWDVERSSEEQVCMMHKCSATVLSRKLL